MVGPLIGCLVLLFCGAGCVALGRRITIGKVAPAMGNRTPENTTEASWAAMRVIVGRGAMFCGAMFIIASPLVLSEATAGGGVALLGVGAIAILVQTARGTARLKTRS